MSPSAKYDTIQMANKWNISPKKILNKHYDELTRDHCFNNGVFNTILDVVIN